MPILHERRSSFRDGLGQCDLLELDACVARKLFLALDSSLPRGPELCRTANLVEQRVRVDGRVDAQAVFGCRLQQADGAVLFVHESQHCGSEVPGVAERDGAEAHF